MKLRRKLYLLYKRSANNTLERLSRQMSCFTADQAQECLSALLDHARLHVPYYKDVIPENTSSAARFEDLPVLTKQLIRDNFERLKSDDLASREWVLNSSGGSSGQPITLVQDREFQDWSLVAQRIFSSQFLGIKGGLTSMVELWGSEKDTFGATEGVKTRLRNWWLDWTLLNTFRMTQKDIRRYVETINRKKPDLIRAYAGSLYEIAKYVKMQGLTLHHPTSIHSAAETLRPFMRELIEEVFGCKVNDFYGSREVGSIAAECARGRMHIFSFYNLIEVVNENHKPVGVGEEGRVLVTTLRNFAMPLVRYDIGDTAVPGLRCDCGCTLPTLEKITGRVTEHFLSRDGDLVHGEFFTHLFYYRDWVSEFQVLQRDYDQIEIYYVGRGRPLEEEIVEITGKIHLVMGSDCRVEWKRVEMVPRTPQGKLLFTRSLVQEERGVGSFRR